MFLINLKRFLVMSIKFYPMKQIPEKCKHEKQTIQKKTNQYLINKLIHK